MDKKYTIDDMTFTSKVRANPTKDTFRQIEICLVILGMFSLMSLVSGMKLEWGVAGVSAVILIGLANRI